LESDIDVLLLVDASRQDISERNWQVGNLAAEFLLDYASANNRAYYAIIHAMRAVLTLDGEDFKKHFAVIMRISILFTQFVIY